MKKKLFMVGLAIVFSFSAVGTFSSTHVADDVIEPQDKADTRT